MNTRNTIFQGLRVAVTGGTSGLGLALVETLHRHGAQVAFIARDAARVHARAQVANEREAEPRGAAGDSDAQALQRDVLSFHRVTPVWCDSKVATARANAEADVQQIDQASYRPSTRPTHRRKMRLA